MLSSPSMRHRQIHKGIIMSKSANKMSILQLSILTAVNMMGSGIIMLPSKLAQVGALSIVS